VLELTETNAFDYLREMGRSPPGPCRVEVLGGGVSNIVLRVEGQEQALVLKQSRPQLRTRDAWFSDRERIYREQEVMQMLRPLLPENIVPEVLFVDRPNFVLAMSAAPAAAVPWKQLLLAGEVDLNLGQQAGTVLGRMHEATARHPELVEPFHDHQVFVQLRVDPFYQRVRERRLEVAPQVAAVIDDMLGRKEALCHGDYTPKNMLIHDGTFTLVDYETACFGDPAMDLGLFLCHMLLKGVRQPERRAGLRELIRQFWESYAAEISYRPVDGLKIRALRHLAVCLLARVDGTSPVDYLPEEPRREAVRRLARYILQVPIMHWEEALEYWEQELAMLAGN
jgi:5-methylthioribose kinase